MNKRSASLLSPASASRLLHDRLTAAVKNCRKAADHSGTIGSFGKRGYETRSGVLAKMVRRLKPGDTQHTTSEYYAATTASPGNSPASKQKNARASVEARPLYF